MNRLLLTLLLPALLLCFSSACTQLPYSRVSKTDYYTARMVPAYQLNGEPTNLQIPNCTVVSAVGFYHNLALIRYAGRKYLVESDALSLIDFAAQTPAYAPGIAPTDRTLYVGPRGGTYYINGNGNRTYVTPESTIIEQPVQTGPRGGQYYYNSNGRKTYIKH